MYEVQVRKTEPLLVASISHKGPYQNLDKVYRKFEEWLEKDHVKRVGYFREIGYDNPMTTPPDECRQEVCVPIAESMTGDDEVQVKQLPLVGVASVVHQGG